MASSPPPEVHKVGMMESPMKFETVTVSDLGSELEGDISIPGAHEAKGDSSDGEFNTLDEPIAETIKRDLKAVGRKLFGALLPNHSKNLLMKDWDLWGPLILCTLMGLLLQEIGDSGAGIQLTALFLLVWSGMATIAYNFVFVQSSTISIFQCFSVLGYCLGPLSLAVVLYEVLYLLSVSDTTLFLRFLIAIGAASWSTYSAVVTFKNAITVDNKYYVYGPIAIYYGLIALLLLYYSSPSHS